jgi:hypothetical protein
LILFVPKRPGIFGSRKISLGRFHKRKLWCSMVVNLRTPNPAIIPGC